MTAIYNNTHIIPELRVLLKQLINQSTGVNEQEKPETNTTQNCTEEQSNQNVLAVFNDIPGRKS